MSDNVVVRIGENSPEYAAFRLMLEIKDAEKPQSEKQKGELRKWLLDTYAECLNVVKQPANRVSPRSQL
jgi:hypothetical protein